MGPEQGSGVPFPAPPLAHCQEHQDELPRQDTTPRALQHGGGVLLSREAAHGLGHPREPTQGTVRRHAVPPAPATPALPARWP